jgi:hypothetical protein
MDLSTADNEALAEELANLMRVPRLPQTAQRAGSFVSVMSIQACQPP